MEVNKKRRIEKYKGVLEQISLSYGVLWELHEFVGTITLEKFPPLIRDIEELIKGAIEGEV